MSASNVTTFEQRHAEIESACNRALTLSVMAARAASDLHAAITETELVAPVALSDDLTGARKVYAAISKLNIAAEDISKVSPASVRAAMQLLGIVP